MQQIVFQIHKPFSEAGLFQETGLYIDHCSTLIRTAFLQRNSKLCLLLRRLFLQSVYSHGEVVMQIPRVKTS